MATLTRLIDDEVVLVWDVPLKLGQQKFRGLYLLPEAVPWLTNDLPKLGSCWNLEETPLQQVDALTNIFVAGETLTYDTRFKPLNHLSDGIWELKTADVRVIGWFVCKDCFIASCAQSAQFIKDYNLYPGLAREAAHRRDLLPLDEPKFVPGENPNEVVSAFDFAP